MAADPKNAPAKTATDPVCGMTVRRDTQHRREQAGETVLFCSSRCAEKFETDPARYSATASVEHGHREKAQDSHSRHGVYTCPMHPEVAQDKPGDCPKCGMSLELAGALPSPHGGEWTCPMHPEVVRDAPGDCPICGMALEPKAPVAGEEDNAELRDMTRRFWFAAVLSVPLLAIVMLERLGIITSSPRARYFM